MNSRPLFHWVWLALVAVCGCNRPAGPGTGTAPAEWFEDITEKCGIRFTPDGTHADPYFMPLVIGGGVALFDYDGDGRLDIFFAPGGEQGHGSPSKLFRQKPDGTFEDVTKAAGVEIYGYGQGAAVGDVNNDGHPDLIVTAHGKAWLFLNNGNGTFTDITKEAGIENPHWGVSAAFVDYDRDGWLDLVIANYVAYDPTKTCQDAAGRRDWCSPATYAGTASRLFRNRGGQGGKVAYEDVTAKAGLAAQPGPGLGVVCADFDGDGWPDLFIANDGKPNFLWMNQKNGTFKEDGINRGVAFNGMGVAEANMGIALGDFDGDGLFDLFVTHLTDETHRLWKQTARGQFRDRTTQFGLSDSSTRSTGFGTLSCDFDRDGAEDLVVVNGRVRRFNQAPPSEPFWSVYGEKNQLYSNDGAGKFTNVSAANPAFCSTTGVHRVVAVGDLDNDGAPDLIVMRVDGPARIYRNIAASRGHWVTVRAIDPALNRDAYGAELTVRAGGRTWRRWMNPGYSFACSNDPRAHVGLGSADRVEEFRVLWPDGTEERFDGGPADRALTLKKGTGAAVPKAR